MSPEIEKAIYSPTTAVTDPKAVLTTIAAFLKENSVQILLGERLSRIDLTKKRIHTDNATYSYGHLINCAGAFADQVAHLMGVGSDYCILPFKGLYYKLSADSPVKINSNIYPLPDARVPFLGVHFTKSIHGEVFIGPTAIPALGRENYHGLGGIKLAEALSIASSCARQYVANKQEFRNLVHQELPKLMKSGFFKDARLLVKGLSMPHLMASTKVGIRAQLFNFKKGLLEMDFIVQKGPFSTHVLNAVSPAFSSALTFSKYILDECLT